MPLMLRGLWPCVLSIALSGAMAPASAQTLTLEEAWRIAEEANPALKSARAGRYALDGQRAESAAPLFNNPVIGIDPSRRVVPQAGGPDMRIREWGASLSQTFEIAGQQGHRRETTRYEIGAFDASVDELRRQVRAEVEERFVRVLSLQRRVSLETENLKLVASAAAAVGKRVAAGEASRLEGNLASVEAERTRNQIGLLGENLTSARAELALLLQLPPTQLPEASGDVARKMDYDRGKLLDSAARRPQLTALQNREQAARSRLELERASAYPDITLGVTAGREGSPEFRESVVGLAVSVPLPLFRRNQAGVGKAMTELTQAQVERQAAARDVQAGVIAQLARVEQLRERTVRLRASVLPPLEENLRLSQSAFREGEIGLTELLLVNRQVLDGRRDALEAETELRFAQIALERAAGLTP
jgi:cobalt-zinc-cadmium efflux system outer membrane protein